MSTRLYVKALRDVTVVVQGDRIESVSPGAVQHTAGARANDLAGRWMLPRMRDGTALAWKVCVSVVAGSDMRYATNDTRQVSDEVVIRGQ